VNNLLNDSFSLLFRSWEKHKFSIICVLYAINRKTKDQKPNMQPEIKCTSVFVPSQLVCEQFQQLWNQMCQTVKMSPKTDLPDPKTRVNGRLEHKGEKLNPQTNIETPATN
jgi:hypothetical protein